MPLSVHETLVRTITNLFATLSSLLDKAEADAAARGYDVSVLLGSRLAPDMFPLSRQIQSASDVAKASVGRLTGVEIPSFPDTETTLAELRERIAKTVAFVQSVPADAYDGADTREVTVKTRDRTLTFAGSDYLLAWALPNFYFHITTAYAILRHNGVSLGKRDFLAGGLASLVK